MDNEQRLKNVEYIIEETTHYFSEIDIEDAMKNEKFRVKFITVSIGYSLKNLHFAINTVLKSNIEQNKKDNYLLELNNLLWKVKEALEQVNVLPDYYNNPTQQIKLTKEDFEKGKEFIFRPSNELLQPQLLKVFMVNRRYIMFAKTRLLYDLKEGYMIQRGDKESKGTLSPIADTLR